MDSRTGKQSKLHGCVAALVLASTSVLTGCQMDVSGQTLPSPWYLTDDVQYFAPAPSEFKLSREAAALKEQREAYESTRQPCCP